jgi:predicted signal transduction protein with EAL and GGDEF domain
VSQGLATYPDNGLTAGELLESADIALYAAKESGKNRVSTAGIESSGSCAAVATRTGTGRRNRFDSPPHPD